MRPCSGSALNVLFGLDQDSSELTHVPGGGDGQYYGTVIDQCSYHGTSQGYTYC